MPKDAVLAGIQSLLSMPTVTVHPQLLPFLATEALATAKPGFLDRLADPCRGHHCPSSRLPLVTFEKHAARLPQTQLLNATDY
jgi:hypothetical protein